jgi:hypothetical protein
MNNLPSTRLRLAHLWTALPFFFVLWAGLHAPIRLLDFWWHLKLGEVIVTTRAIPDVDLFSYTAAGKPFVAQSWLADAIYFAVHAAGGIEWLVVFNALLLAATLFFTWKDCRQYASDVRAAAAGSLIAVLGLVLFRNMRPQGFSFVLFALFVWQLLRSRRDERAPLWILPAAMLLWVNLHGAFVLGLALCGLAWIAQPSRKLAITTLLCSAATMINPHGWRIYEAVLDVGQDKGSQQFVSEWLPPRIDEWQTILTFFLPLAVTALALLLSRRWPDRTQLLFLIAFAIFGFTARRNGIWFSLVAAPAVAASLRLPASQARENRAMNYLIAAMFLTVTVLISPWVYPAMGRSSLLDGRTPVRAAEFLARNDLRGRLFHPQDYGDYLLWRLWPAQRTFLDGRVHLFGDVVIRDYRRTMYGLDWKETFDRYGVTLVLLSRREAETVRLLDQLRNDAGWERIYEDRRDVLYARAAPRTSPSR